jgi:putative nucleotidyltransferase with HDIG domain
LLPDVSAERQRDELYRILGIQRPALALRAMDLLGIFPFVLPELPTLKGVVQSPPHLFDVWEHTLIVLQKLHTLLEVLGPRPDPDSAASMHLGLVSLRLGRYREEIAAHLANALNPDRPLRPLLFLAALYHDIGKPHTRTVDEDGRIRFFEHEQIGAGMIARRARALQLSNAEINRLKSIVRHHMRPLLLAQTGQHPTRRAIYRFFHDAGPAGVDICLLSLADVLGTYGPTLSQDVWARHLDIVRALLEAWWERPAESVSPPPIVTGHDLIAELGLEPGPVIGKILEAIREAQATGRVHNRREALELARDMLKENSAG